MTEPVHPLVIIQTHDKRRNHELRSTFQFYLYIKISAQRQNGIITVIIISHAFWNKQNTIAVQNL